MQRNNTTTQGKARQDYTILYSTSWQDTRQGKARQDDKAKQCTTHQEVTRQDSSMQYKTINHRTRQDSSIQHSTKQHNARQDSSIQTKRDKKQQAMQLQCNTVQFDAMQCNKARQGEARQNNQVILIHKPGGETLLAGGKQRHGPPGGGAIACAPEGQAIAFRGFCCTTGPGLLSRGLERVTNNMSH